MSRLEEIRVGSVKVGPGHRPFIIAEMSGNHNQSLDRAFQIIDAAAAAGAHAMKIQTYTAETMTLKLSHGEFMINDPKSLWNGRNLYDLYDEAHTPWDWHKPIFDRCREKGMIGFSTPFDDSAVDFLESLNVPLYKIASFEMTDIPLIQRVAKTGKPMIMSTGMGTASEVAEAVAAARGSGARDIVMLKCTSTYPATPENTNIRTIPHLRDLCGTLVGLSDHTMGVGVSVGAVALGACVIEKHFTLSRAEGGVDSAFSLEPHELKALVVETERAWQSLGEIRYGATEAEKKSLQFRRSIYISGDLKAGTVLTKNNVRIIRPGYGLEPKYFDMVLGKKVRTDVKAGTPVSWDMLG